VVGGIEAEATDIKTRTETKGEKKGSSECDEE
jgi:hypothetical protein